MSIWVILTADGRATMLSRDEPTAVALTEASDIICTASAVEAFDDERERVRITLGCNGTTATLVVTSAPGQPVISIQFGAGAGMHNQVFLAVGPLDPGLMLAQTWE